MTFSPALTLYRATTVALGPLVRPWLNARARAGKEDAARLGERFGDYAQTRPAGRVMWFHAASVGESGVAIALIEAMAERDVGLSFLLTTGTRTSAELAAKRAPPRTVHAYAPVDRRDAVRKFLAYWRPDAGVFVESELWPNLILEAASTHSGEDEIALAAHAELRKQTPNALLILAPRHPERGAAVAALANAAPHRSAGQAIGDAPVYVADTMGELGLLYGAAPVSLVAGSLLPTLKGHNPIEPAKIGSAILTGPYVESFQDVFDALFAAGGARRVADASALAAAIALLWHDTAARETQVGAARAFATQGAEAFDMTVAKLAEMSAAHAPA
ncbi:MAG: hypothetical protein HY054_03435 [Proteobacteria bacterium]|nr:hypothetical protein [Pseudomonadota bacterium]